MVKDSSLGGWWFRINCNLGCYLIEFSKFSPQKRNLPSSLPKQLPSGEYILYVNTDIPDIPQRFGGLQVLSNRIGFVRDMFISYYSLGTLKRIKPKFRKKLANLSNKWRFKVPGTITFKKKIS